jgi:hypothetical protein
MASTMDRREAIKTVSMLLGGAFATSSGLLGAVERAHARAKNPGTQVGVFTAQDIALLDEVADTILPETKTPGAKAAHVGAFMALMVTDSYSDRDAGVFREGLKQLSGFTQLAPAQRITRLEQLDREAKTYMDARAPGATTPPHFFRLMKELTLLGYFTSEIGVTQAQRYRETPGRFDPCEPYTPGETAWAGHA